MSLFPQPNMKDREKNPNQPCQKESKEMTANCSLSVLDIHNVTYSRKCESYGSFLKAADLFQNL